MSKNNFTYTLQIDAEIQNLLQKTNQVKQAMQGVMNTGKAPGAEKIFGSIEKAIEKLQSKASQPITSIAAFESLQKDAAAVGTSLGKLGTIVEDLGKMGMADKLELLPPDLKQKITEANTALANFSKVQSEAAKKSDELVTAEKDLAKAQKELKSAEGRVADKKALIKAQEAKVANDKAEAAAIKTKIDALKKYQATNAAYEKAGADKRRAGGSTKGVEGLNLPKDRAAAQGVANGLGIDLKDTKAVEATLTRLNDQYREASKVVTDAEATQRRYSTQLNEAQNAATVASGKVGALETSVQGLNAEFEKNKAQDTQAAYAQLRAEAGRLGVDISNIPLDYTEQNFLELNDAMNQLAINGIAQVDAGMDNIQAEMEETNTAAREMSSGLNTVGGEMQKLDATVSNTTAFTSRIAQFVGLQGGIQLARRAMRDAINTIKELDAAMTEMAVVTEFEVGDYWDQLPEYTQRANNLGVAIKDAYESATLYYQQGLKTNEVVAMSNQTLKMARIAGLSAEDATNKMTAALRGFNMELNETSAERVADVYSELAAITASDVDEISSAMTKTASIAASAGMEFETTAAFLSQIIETTRESAETAGTALKTVIARFQELKKDPSEIGEVDGEIVDANKIETALRSVGVSLRDARGQFRELDDVFLELSGKWDSLDTNTQRYIATIAAGSRQQSRFIAMMSDYSRTQELVTAANASAGASNAQFEKTMDSLESKLNQLKNAWDSFIMGIMNSDVLKAGIDILTGIIGAINSITDAFGQFSGAAKIGLLVAALYLGDKALKVFMTSLKGGSTIFQAFGKVGKTALSGIQVQLTKLKYLVSSTFGKKGINIGFSKDTLSRSKQDLAAYTQATRKQASAKAMMNNLEAKGATDTALYANVSKRAADAEKERLAVEGNLVAALGLNEAQMAATTAMTAMGVSADKAAILAKAGISAENLAAAVSYSGLSAAQVGAQLAAKLENASSLRVLSTKIGLTVSNWAQKASEDAKTGSLWQSITATIAQTMANWGMQASMWPILVVVGLIIVAIAALVAIIYVIIKAYEKWKNSQPDAQLAALEEKIDKARESAEAAKQAYDDLLSARTEYDTLVNQVDELTEGTTEWKNAVTELNRKILELIDLYPELMQYMIVAENGVMSIDAEGWDALIGKKARAASNSQTRVFMTQYEEAKEMVERNEFKTRDVRVNETEDYVETKQVLRDFDLGWRYEDELKALSELTWGTEEYILAKKQLIESMGTITEKQETELNSFDAAAKKLAELKKEAEDYKKLVLQGSGSVEARGNANYNRIIESLEGSYDTIQSKEKEKLDERWEQGKNDSEHLWDNGSNETSKKLKTELLKYDIVASEEEDKALAQLLAAKGGTNYTDEQLNDISASARDEKLAKELQEIEAAENIGTEYVDKLYELQEKNKSIEKLYSGTLDLDEKTLAGLENQAKNLSDGNEILEEALKARVETIRQGQKDINLELEKIYGKSMNALEFAGSNDQAQQFIRTYKEMVSEASEGMGILFADMFEGFSPEQQADYFANYGDINWGSAIDGAAALKEMLLSDNVALQDFAAKTLLVEKATYSATAQMNEFYKSLSPEALEELAKDGEITATEMLEMAKSNDKLATMMDTTGVSAASLAKYYELLEDGTLSAHEATTNFIQALDELNAASNAIENAFAFIDTFEPSRSQTEISDFFSEMRQSALDLYEMGAYGDQQLRDYILHFIGDTNWQAILDKNNGDMQAALDQAMAQINTYGENMYGTWKTLVEQGLQGVSMGKDGSIQFDMSQIGDLDQLKQQIMDMGWSEAMADALVADAQTFSVDLENQLDELGVAEMFETWLQGAMDVNGKTIIPKGQVEAMAEELNVSFDQLKADLESQNINVVEWVTEDGKAAEGFKDLREQMIQDAKDANAFDLDTQYQLLLELGLEDEAAKAELAKMAGALEGVPLTIDNETYTYTNGKIYDSNKKAIEGSTIDGLINGVQDPRAVAAEELAALEQGEMMAKAQAAGSIAASRAAIAASAKDIDDFITSIYKFFGSDKKSNIASKYAQSGTDKLIGLAESSITSRNQEQKKELNATINSKQTATNSSAAATALANKYSSDAYSGVSSAYANKNAQEAGVPKAEEGEEMWENAYDRLWNLNKQLNTVIRERENLERNYERALDDSTKTAQDLADITADQLLKLQQEAELQKSIASQAIANAEAYMSAYSKYDGLYSFDTQTGEVQVDWETVGNLGWTSDQGSDFEEFISYLEEQGDTYREATDSLYDIEDSVKEIQQRGRESTSEIYNQVKEGLAKQYEEQIDELENINEGIQEASEAIVSKIQEQINDAREARDREKAQKELEDKKTRLAYLQRDTSGGNALEILSLQQEIEDEQQSHIDTLVDDAISKLEEQNEKAAEQREQQIEIQREQLDAYLNSSVVWNDVKQLVDSGFTQVANGVPFAKTEAGHLAGLAEEVATMNPLEAEDFYKELERSASEGAIYQGFVKVTGTGEINTISTLADSVISAIHEAATDAEPPVVNVTVSSGGDVTTTYGGYPQGSAVTTPTPQQTAIQQGITAMTSFRSGGAGHVIDNSDWIAARDAYVAAGGDQSQFYNVVADAVASGDSNYTYGANYDASQKRITTGTFPSSYTSGLGTSRTDKDTFDITLRDLAGNSYQISDALIYTTSAGLASASVSSALNLLYSGTTPATGWLAMYQNVPYVYAYNGWRKFFGKENEVRTEMLKYLNPKFKDGGLADFTGPAWLDGTKSKPEIVLNQSDSANFMQLRDILADILHGTSSLTRTDRGEGGDNYYDIEINVDSLKDDYDVEQLADKIRSMIYKDSMYRNVNSINGLR